MTLDKVKRNEILVYFNHSIVRQTIKKLGENSTLTNMYLSFLIFVTFNFNRFFRYQNDVLRWNDVFILYGLSIKIIMYRQFPNPTKTVFVPFSNFMQHKIIKTIANNPTYFTHPNIRYILFRIQRVCHCPKQQSGNYLNNDIHQLKSNSMWENVIHFFS